MSSITSRGSAAADYLSIEPTRSHQRANLQHLEPHLNAHVTKLQSTSWCFELSSDNHYCKPDYHHPNSWHIIMRLHLSLGALHQEQERSFSPPTVKFIHPSHAHIKLASPQLSSFCHSVILSCALCSIVDMLAAVGGEQDATAGTHLTKQSGQNCGRAKVTSHVSNVFVFSLDVLHLIRGWHML